MLSREWNLAVSDLSEIHQLRKDFLNALDEHLPHRMGGDKSWSFEKAYRILHKVHELSCVAGQKTLHVRDLSMLIFLFDQECGSPHQQ
jgi:hypothetical protein